MSFLQKLKSFFKASGSIASQMAFPEGIVCMACNDELDGSEKHELCRNCFLEYNKSFCDRCGRGIEDLAQFCDRCIEHGEYHFDRARSSLAYNDTAKKLVYNFKYGGARYLAKNLAEFLFETAKEEGFLEELDYLTFVPLHKKRKRIRGYNQAESLAKEFSKHCGIVAKPLLIKKIHTKNLAKLNRQERIDIIKNSFELVEFKVGESVDNGGNSGSDNSNSDNKALSQTKPLKNKNILLIDDVLTTTATADECARILKKLGAAKSVRVLTLTSVASNKNY